MVDPRRVFVTGGRGLSERHEVPSSMKAAFIHRYGGNEVVEVGPRPVPTPGRRQVLVRVVATCVNPRDWLLRDGRYVFRHLVRGFPKVLGSDVSGVVVAKGSGVRHFCVGDVVFGLQTPLGQMGGYAEYMAVHESAVAKKSDAMTHEEAAGLPVAGLTALQSLRDEGELRAGERVLVLGASGGVGGYAVQVAKRLKATVIGVSSGKNADFVRELGADEHIDYTTEDVVARAHLVDVVLDAIGKGDLARYAPCLAPGGRYVTTVPTANNAKDQLRTTTRRRLFPKTLTSRMIVIRARRADLETLARMADAGALRTPIDSVHDLDHVTDALARSRTQRARGKIIVRVV